MNGDPARSDVLITADVAARADHAFGLVESWMFSEPMAQLLALFGMEMPDGIDPGRPRRSNGDGHHAGVGPDAGPVIQGLNESLPDWLRAAFAGRDDERFRRLSPLHQQTLGKTLALESEIASDFDFRAADQYRERSQAAVAQFDDERRQRVLELTTGLGLVTPCPPRFERYDRTLVLGGGYMSPVLRSRQAVRLGAAGVELGELAFLGSPRFLVAEPSEASAVRGYAPDAVDEYDLMKAAACAEFDLAASADEFLCGCLSAELICPAWRYRGDWTQGSLPAAYTHERKALLTDPADRPAGFVLSASTGRPPYRPDTSDTLTQWVRHVGPRPHEHVLAVTTQVFVPFQTFETVRRLYLTHGIEVDVIGFESNPHRPQTAEYLLQETLSAVRSGRRLLVEAAEVLMGRR